MLTLSSSTATMSSIPLIFALLLLIPQFISTTTFVVQAAESKGTDLGGGIITLTNVDDRALLALDIRDMTENCAQGDYVTAKNIYTVGRNSPMYDSSGDELPTKRSLADLSIEFTKMAGQPSYVFQIYGLSGNNVDFIDQHYAYADAFVRAKLEERTGTIPAEAALVLNLWMYATHELWNAVDDCARISSGDVNLDVLGLNNKENRAQGFDRFMAYWIGAGQTPASDSGHSLYAITQTVGSFFAKNDPEATANANIKALYAEARSILAFDNACRPGSDSLEQLWIVANRIVSQMSTPLIQMLIHSMKMGDSDRVRMYATAIVPQMSQCRPSVYRRLKQNLVDRKYNPDKFVSILTDLQSLYDCLGLTCEDIGAYQVDEVGKCADLPINFPLADYTPSSSVHQLGKIDLDILQMKILLSIDSGVAYAYARYIYMFGKNSAKFRANNNDPYITRSLRQLATTTQRRSAQPFYLEFEEFHDDQNYADTMIMETLQGEGKWGKSNRVQRREYIIKTVQYQVIYMYALAEMADALTQCTEGDTTTQNDGGVHAWDEVAALLIGSLEGYGKGGSSDFADGTLLWNLANKRSTQFNTVNGDGYAEVNAQLEDLLYAGKGEIDAYDCENLRRTVRNIEHLVLVPMIQSVLRYAILNEKHAANSPSKDLAEGEAFAFSLLPIVAYYDGPSAQVLEDNMIVMTGKEPVMDGPQAVADAFFIVMDDFGLGCEYIGQSDGVDACRLIGSQQRSESTTRSKLMAPLVIGILIMVFFACMLLTL